MFRENDSTYDIKNVRQDLNKVVEYWKKKDYWRNAIKVALQEDRKLSEEISLQCDAFFIDEDEMPKNNDDFLSEYPLGFVKYNKFIFSGRIVYPIKDVNGDVMGFLGWDKFETPKYLDSINYGYRAKQGSFAGMEDLRTYYETKPYLFITEGYVDTLWLKSQGFAAMSSLGSHLSYYQLQILKRFGSKVIILADNDEAGNDWIKQIKRKLPKALSFQARYGKDVDGMRLIDNGKYLEDTLKELNAMVKNPYISFRLFIRR